MSADMNLADWYRAGGVVTPQGSMDRRWAAVEELSNNLDSQLVVRLAKLFGLPGANEADVPAVLRETLQQKDDGFAAKGNLQELKVIAGAVLRHAMNVNADYASVAALSLVCVAFDDRMAKIPEKDHVRAAQQYLAGQRATIAAKTEVPAITVSAFSKDAYASLLPASSFTPPGFAALHEQLFSAFDTVTKNYAKTLQQARKSIAALALKTDLQGEELNMLWWLQGGFSGALDQPFSRVDEKTAAILFPLELARLTRIPPGPEGIPGILLKSLQMSGGATGKPLSIATAVNAVPRAERERFSEAHDVDSVGEMCPVLLAVVTSLVTDGPDDWLPVYRKACDVSAEKPMPVFEVALQAYREHMLLQALASE